MHLHVRAPLPPAAAPARREANPCACMLLLLATAFSAGCTEDMPPPGGAASTNASTEASDAPDPARGLAAIAAGALLIDVRSPEEFAQGHLPDAHLLPVDEFAAGQARIADWAAGDRSRPVVVYCASGRRATRAARMLREAGYQNVINGGGLSDLQSAPH